MSQYSTESGTALAEALRKRDGIELPDAEPQEDEPWEAGALCLLFGLGYAGGYFGYRILSWLFG